MSEHTSKDGVAARAAKTWRASRFARKLNPYGIVLTCIALASSAQAMANEPAVGKQLRVKMSLEVTGSYRHKGPLPESQITTLKSTLNNSYTTEYIISADPVLKAPVKTNPMDPDSQKEMDDYAAKVKAHNDRVYHSADHLRGKRPGAPASLKAVTNPMAMTDADMIQRIKACGQDQACKQKLAMEMMAQQRPNEAGGSDAMLGEVRVISDRCANDQQQKIGNKDYENCMNAAGEKRSMHKQSATDDEPEVAEPPDRYLLFRNGVDCAIQGHGKVDESYTVRVVDGGEGGMKIGEHSGVIRGEADADPKNRLVCANEQAVFDIRTKTYWLNGMHTVVVNVTDEAGAGRRYENADAIHQWIGTVLHGAPASGTKTQKFGYQSAKFTWSIVLE